MSERPVNISTVEIKRSQLNAGDSVAAIRRPDAEDQRPVSRTGASSQPDQNPVKGYNDSISWGLLFKPHGRLKLTLLAICIDIATL